MPDTEPTTRTRRKTRRRASAADSADVQKSRLAGSVGGRYRPLDESALPIIDQAVRGILQDIGMAEAPEIVVERVTAAGGSLDADGRLRFSADLIERALQGMQKDFTLCGRSPEHDMHLGGGRVHVGSGGAAPLILDLDSGVYRESTLKDLYDAARLVDSLEHLHFFSRSLVARDMPDLRSLDINTAYACLAGTSKHILSAVSKAEHVEEIAEICYCVAGSRDAFLQRPFPVAEHQPAGAADAFRCRFLRSHGRGRAPRYPVALQYLRADGCIESGDHGRHRGANHCRNAFRHDLRVAGEPRGKNHLRHAPDGHRFTHRSDEWRQRRGRDSDGGERTDG